MFLGEYRCAVDEKGRVSVPYRFRQELPPELILTRGFDDCLALYPKSEWEKLALNLWSVVSGAHSRGRHLLRLFYRNALECALDAQGRVTVPANMREAVAIGREVIVTGMNHRIEFWDPATLEAYDRERSESLEELVEGTDGVAF
jgi:MraZ protein